MFMFYCQVIYLFTFQINLQKIIVPQIGTKIINDFSIPV